MKTTMKVYNRASAFFFAAIAPATPLWSERIV
jgi:hypothetical protein